MCAGVVHGFTGPVDIAEEPSKARAVTLRFGQCGPTSAVVLGRLVNVARAVWVLQPHGLDTGSVLI